MSGDPEFKFGAGQADLFLRTAEFIAEQDFIEVRLSVIMAGSRVGGEGAEPGEDDSPQYRVQQTELPGAAPAGDGADGDAAANGGAADEEPAELTDTAEARDAAAQEQDARGETKPMDDVLDEAEDLWDDADDAPEDKPTVHVVEPDFGDEDGDDEQEQEQADLGYEDDDWPLTAEDVPDTVCPICALTFESNRSRSSHLRAHTLEERAEAGFDRAKRELRQREIEENRELEAPDLNGAYHRALTYLVQLDEAGLTPVSTAGVQDFIERGDDRGYVHASPALRRLYDKKMANREKRPAGEGGRKVWTYVPTAMGRGFIEDAGPATGTGVADDADEDAEGDDD